MLNLLVCVVLGLLTWMLKPLWSKRGAVGSQGTEFRRWNSSSGAWESIAEIQSIDGPKKTRTTIDTTALDTVGGYMTFITGLRDPGGLTMTMNFTRDTYETLNTDFDDDTIQNYEIVLPDGDTTSLEFEGFVTELGLSVPTNDKISAPATIKASGQITIESGSGPSAGA